MAQVLTILSTILLLVIYTSSYGMIVSGNAIANSSSNNNTCTNANQCKFSRRCALCVRGRSPACTQALCIDGKCKIIAPCSLSSTTSTIQNSTAIPQCDSDGQCPFPQICVASCKLDTGPLCAKAKCVNGKCQTISPCSEGSQCTSKNLTECVDPMQCARCLSGFGPPCTQVTCENGLCKTIYPCSISSSGGNGQSSTTLPADQCKADADCAYVKLCVDKCPNNYTPLCALSKCINGQCVVTNPCSQKIECTDKNVSQCVSHMICARCLFGFGPPCTQVTCENGLCKTISPCSISSSDGNGQSSTTLPADQCKVNADCAYVKLCVDKCPNNYTPLCALSKCINGQCVVTKPCSQKIECTDKNVSQCVSHMICALCLSGLGPLCTQITCENGLCKTISPCSIRLNSTTATTKLPGETCTSDAGCPHSQLCKAQCPNGTGPLCASSKCVNHKCIAIPPCSQRYCKILTQCPYKSDNCAPCPKGYEPVCEQPDCSLGVCSVILPCSKQTTSVTNSATG
ncbi:unnamed protein product [Rotaria magnacalcarata]|uniref:Uncharacterized protein n=3 Tax=Rotaria magnacalcarata TaxID=392030 RepID=A0A816NA93_9BILA|nr:unnamed protein product [Rotaria magnacalcarata]